MSDAMDSKQQLEREIAQRTAELERANAELRVANRFLNSMIENIPDMIFVKDAANLRFVRFNRAGEELLGYSRDELLGRNDYDFFPREEADFFTAKDREVLAAGTVRDIPEEPVETRHKGVRILHTKKIPILDEDGAPRYLLGISEDITERKARESELHAANRELEAFSYSVSHDLRAPLRHIQGYLTMLSVSAGATLPADAVRYLVQVDEAARTMGRLIDDLLQFSRMKRAEIHDEPFELGPLVAQVVRELKEGIRDRRVEWKVGALPAVRGDMAMLRQVFVNLLSNAVKYTRPREAATIEVGRAGDENGNAVIFVRDNGVGFDMQHAGKLFGVFQRLHAATEFEGAGIGLASVQRIVARHGGRIWAEARPGAGATFFFTLPRSGAPASGP
jgi:PAS domain S-box-containing protein